MAPGALADFDLSCRNGAKPLDLGKEDILIKKACDKVVSTHIDSHDNIHGLDPRRKKHDRNLEPCESLNQWYPAVEWKANIHEDQVGSVSDKDPKDIL